MSGQSSTFINLGPPLPSPSTLSILSPQHPLRNTDALLPSYYFSCALLCLSKLCLCLHLKPKLLKQKLVRRYGLVVGAVLSLTVGL